MAVATMPSSEAVPGAIPKAVPGAPSVRSQRIVGEPSAVMR
jgi:hypothetical protein